MKVAKRSRDSRSKVTRPLVDCQTTVFSTFQAKIAKFLKKVAERSRDNRRRFTRSSADCQTTFIHVSSKSEKNLMKSRWTVTRQSSEVPRSSADCRTTLLRRFKQIREKFDEKSLNGHATVVGRKRDRRPDWQAILMFDDYLTGWILAPACLQQRHWTDHPDILH